MALYGSTTAVEVCKTKLLFYQRGIHLKSANYCIIKMLRQDIKTLIENLNKLIGYIIFCLRQIEVNFEVQSVRVDTLVYQNCKKTLIEFPFKFLVYRI